MSETSSLVRFHPQIHRFSTADGHSCAELAGTGHSSASRNLDTGRPGTWSACHEPGTELHWAQSARVPSDTGTRVRSKSVTLQVPFWHCVHHGTKPLRKKIFRKIELFNKMRRNKILKNFSPEDKNKVIALLDALIAATLSSSTEILLT